MFNEKKNNDALLSDLVSELNVKKLTGKCLRLIDAQLQCTCQRISSSKNKNIFGQNCEQKAALTGTWTNLSNVSKEGIQGVQKKNKIRLPS